MIEMNQSVTIPGKDTHQIGIVFIQYIMFIQFPGNFFVFAHANGKAFCQYVTP